MNYGIYHNVVLRYMTKSLWNFETITGSLMTPKWQKLASQFQKFLALFFDLYPFIFISQINLASLTGSSATRKISRLVH